MTKYAQLIANFQLAIIILMVSSGPDSRDSFICKAEKLRQKKKLINKDKISFILNSIYKNHLFIISWLQKTFIRPKCKTERRKDSFLLSYV